jgi:uncharacterized membrane protein
LVLFSCWLNKFTIMKKLIYTLLFAATVMFTACKGSGGNTGGASADSGSTGSSGATDTSMSGSAGGTMGGSDTSTTGTGGGTTGPVTDTAQQNQQQPQQ